MVCKNVVKTMPKGMHIHKNSVLTINKHNSENDENALPTTFKALCYETSVYKYYVELKEDALTEQGFLDLAKVHDLRVTGAGQFLKNLRLENRLRQLDLAKILNVQRETVNNWENNYTNTPLQSLVKIAEACDISQDTIYSLIDQGKFKTKTRLPVKFGKIRDIIQYLTPHKSGAGWRTTVIKCSNETLSKIKTILNVKTNSRCYSKLIASKELHNYLTTFFRYIKVPKIQPPLTSEVKLWHDNGVDLKRAIICPCLQNDGSIRQGNQKYRLTYYGLNKALHDYFIDAMYYEYNELPTSYFLLSSSGDCYATDYSQKSAKEIVDEVMNLAGNAKTSPANRQTVEEYLKEPQPHLNYLINASETEQKIALRIWASAEGHVTLYRKNGRVHPCLGISCAHPDLATQLKQIAQRFNIKFAIRRQSNWSGIGSLFNATTNRCIKFLKLGGFIKGVKISSSSKYHEGIDKDVLTLGILEFKVRQDANQELRNLSLQKIHDEINKIIKNKQYNTADYYINYFS